MWHYVVISGFIKKYINKFSKERERVEIEQRRILIAKYMIYLVVPVFLTNYRSCEPKSKGPIAKQIAIAERKRHFNACHCRLLLLPILMTFLQPFKRIDWFMQFYIIWNIIVCMFKSITIDISCIGAWNTIFRDDRSEIFQLIQIHRERKHIPRRYWVNSRSHTAYTPTPARSLFILLKSESKWRQCTQCSSLG